MIFDHMPRVRPVRSQEEFDVLATAAKLDKHDLVAPCWGVYRGDKPIGGVTINPFPVVLFWMDSKQAKPRDSVEVINAVENQLVLGGASGVVVPVQHDSPFRNVMSELGYRIDSGTYMCTKLFNERT
jgi:hypothetical protein